MTITSIITTICLCLICIYIGITIPLLFKKREPTNHPKKKSKVKNHKSTTKARKCIKTMDLILIIIGCILVIFTVYMILLFREYGAIPDTLVTCVYAALAGECGIMGWIRTNKDRTQNRKWELEDREEMNEHDSSEDYDELENNESNSEDEGG